jgi:anti-sigma factor ChrR (cupin superfamily)
MKHLKLIAILISLSLVAAVFGAEEAAAKKPAHKMASMEKPVMLTPGDLKWGDAPPVFSAGAKLAVLEGDPGKAGPYTVRLQIPDGYKIMPHWHPKVERVTVISGEFHAGMGDKLQEEGSMTFPAGSFAALPAHMHHFAWAKGETVVQVHGDGPFQLTYVNPADDPSGMQGKKKAAPKKAQAKPGA